MSGPFYLPTGQLETAVYFIQQQVFKSSVFGGGKHWIGVNQRNRETNHVFSNLSCILVNMVWKVSSLLEKLIGMTDVHMVIHFWSKWSSQILVHWFFTPFHHQNSSGAVQKMDNVWPQGPPQYIQMHRQKIGWLTRAKALQERTWK